MLKTYVNTIIINTYLYVLRKHKARECGKYKSWFRKSARQKASLHGTWRASIRSGRASRLAPRIITSGTTEFEGTTVVYSFGSKITVLSSELSRRSLAAFVRASKAASHGQNLLESRGSIKLLARACSAPFSFAPVGLIARDF